MRIRADLPVGVTALLFEQARARRALESRMVTRLLDADFQEVVLPVLDYFEPYRPLLSEEIRDGLYRFVDRDGELLALRGDFTPMLARLLAQRLQALELPLALFYRGDVVRYEEPRPGRLRESYQLGAEWIAEPRSSVRIGASSGEHALVEERMLRMFLELLLEQSDARFHVVLGHAGALDQLLVEPPTGMTSADLTDALARRDRELVRRGPAPLLAVLEDGVPDDLSVLGTAAAEAVRALQALAARLNDELSSERIDLSIDLAEYAGHVLDEAVPSERHSYYDGILFRAYPSGSALSVGNGGRYDRLLHSLGADASAVGFAIGVDGLVSAGSNGERGT